MDFLKTLVYNYIVLAFADELGDKIPASDRDFSPSQSVSDSFQKYYRNDKKTVVKKEIKAYKIRGEKNPDFRLGIIEGTLNTKSVIELAHKYNTTVTVFLVAMLILQIGREMPEMQKSRPVVISVPVNLRNYFDSGSSRNFFAVIKVPYNFRTGNGTIEDIIDTVRKSFDKQLERENITDIMNRYAALEHKFYMRIVPLPLKILSIKIANIISEKYVTAAFSNISIIKMPEKIRDYIHGFNIFFSTEKLQVCMCSFDDKMTISFTSPFQNTSIQQRFFRELAALGVDTVIASNNFGKNNFSTNTNQKQPKKEN